MIRPILAVLIAAFILLFVWQYAAFTDRIRPEPLQVVETAAAGQYDIRVNCTFPCQGNAFGSPAISVRFRDRVLDEVTDPFPAGKTLIIEDVPDIKQGWNDFLVEVTPVESLDGQASSAFQLDAAEGDDLENPIARAIRVQVLHDGNVIASELVWSDGSGPFGELVRIQVARPDHPHP